jgi:hypothetical protein
LLQSCAGSIAALTGFDKPRLSFIADRFQEWQRKAGGNLEGESAPISYMASGHRNRSEVSISALRGVKNRRRRSSLSAFRL